MGNEKSVVVSTGGSFTGMLGILFLVLKLTGTIAWSWWWVTLPFWIGPAFVLVTVLLLLPFIIRNAMRRPRSF